MERIDSILVPIQVSNALTRKMPPYDAGIALINLSQMTDEVKIQEQILDAIKVPLHIGIDQSKGVEFIKSSYYKTQDNCFRSPVSNNYYPQTKDEGAKYPTREMRQLEESAYEIYQEYIKAYYNDAVCSVHAWETKRGFDITFVCKRVIGGREKEQGLMDCINHFQVTESGTKYTYLLKGTIMIKYESSQCCQIQNIKILLTSV